MIDRLKSRRTAASIALTGLALSAAGLSGCTGTHGPQAASSGGGATAAAVKKKLKVSQFYTGTSTNPQGGTFTPSSDGSSVIVQNRPFIGSFEVTLKKKTEVPKKANPQKTVKVKALSGTYYSLVNGTSFSNGTGQWAGLQVVRFNQRKLGIGCVQFDATTTNNELNSTGNFALVGGTGAAKRMRFSGTITQVSQPLGGGTANISGAIDGEIKLRKKPIGPTDECRSLFHLLP